MSWQQLTLQTGAQHAERVSELLSEAGALAVTLRDAQDEAIYEPAPDTTPLWTRTEVTALFEADADLEILLGSIKDALRALPPYHIETLAEQDWVRLVQQDIKPLCFGARLWVCPGTAALPADGVRVLLDPGLAFGTGTHPTTALCLEWLAAHDITGDNVLDYGCGSGILALAAVKLGARHAFAVDHDAQALQATQDNARKNTIESRISTVAPHDLPDIGVNTLLANILATPLIELAPRLAQRVVAGGHLVLSGILCEQAQEVSEAYRPWCDVTLWAKRDGWVCLEAVRKSAMV